MKKKVKNFRTVKGAKGFKKSKGLKELYAEKEFKKNTIVIFIIVVFFLILMAYVLQSKFSGNVVSGYATKSFIKTEGEKSSVTSCIDSDGKKDYNTAGYVVKTKKNKPGKSIYFDYCRGENEVREYYCYRNSRFVMLRRCANGCEDVAGIVPEHPDLMVGRCKV